MKYPMRTLFILTFATLVALSPAKVVQTINGFNESYPAGKIGGSNPVPQDYVPLMPAKEYYLDYQVYFESGWDWVKGGKLPGLVGGTHTSGCASIVPDGWSARFMWRTGGQGEVYLYNQDRKNHCGDDFFFPGPGAFSIGKWNRITEHVVINTPGKNDGIVEAWLNGQKRISLTTVQLRGTVADSVALVDQVSLETFYGGSSKSWAPTITTHSRFSSFYVRNDLPDFTLPFVDSTPPTTVESPGPMGAPGLVPGRGFAQPLPGAVERGAAGGMGIFDLRGRWLRSQEGKLPHGAGMDPGDGNRPTK